MAIVLFNTDGFGNIPSQDIPVGNLIQRPEDPFREGYVISEWYTESNFLTMWDFDVDVVADNMNLFAKWVDINSLDKATIISFEEAEAVSDDDVYYTVAKDTNNELVDRSVKASKIKEYIFGKDSILFNALTPDFNLSVMNTGGKNNIIKVGEFEKRLFGTSAITINNELRIRAVKADGTTRGFVTIGEIGALLVKADEEIVSIANQNTVSIRLKDGESFKKITTANFRKWIEGTDTFTAIADTDSVSIYNATKRGSITLNKFIEYIVPSRTIVSSDEINDNLNIVASSTVGRGNIKLSAITSYIAGKLNLPLFTGTDNNVSPNTTIMYRDNETHGYMTINKIKSLILNDQAINNLDSDTLSLRFVNGVASFSAVKTSIIDTVKASVFDISNLNDINSGDGIIFRSVGENTKFSNISYNTLRNKIISHDTVLSPVSVDSADRVFIIRGDGSMNGCMSMADLVDYVRSHL